VTRQPRGILTSLAWLKELFSHDGAMWLLLLRKDRSERDALEISHVLVKSKRGNWQFPEKPGEDNENDIPIEREIISCSGFGLTFIPSTMARIGLLVRCDTKEAGTSQEDDDESLIAGR